MLVVIVVKIGNLKATGIKCRDVYNVRFYKFTTKMFEFPQFLFPTSEVISLVS